jgi:hypothetical protein
MSYSIFIGEARVEEPSLEDFKEFGFTQLDVTVDEVRSDLAPTFSGDDLTENSNGRHPSYVAWAEFAKATGLHGFFFDKEIGLMSQHPGAARLHPEHGQQVRNALKAYRQRYPYTKAGWCPCAECQALTRDREAPHDEEIDEGSSGHLARLLWLDFWITWALANCKIPTLCNR